MSSMPPFMCPPLSLVRGAKLSAAPLPHSGTLSLQRYSNISSLPLFRSYLQAHLFTIRCFFVLFYCSIVYVCILLSYSISFTFIFCLCKVVLGFQKGAYKLNVFMINHNNNMNMNNNNDHVILMTNLKMSVVIVMVYECLRVFFIMCTREKKLYLL